MQSALKVAASLVGRDALGPSWLSESRLAVDAYLAALLAAAPHGAGLEALAEASGYAVRGGGKRLRPLLVLAVAELYRPRDEEALALAAATELIHAASLALDDLPCMDDAHLRRGREAAHVAFGEATTILAALGLWSEAARLVASVRSVPVQGMVSEMAAAVGREGLVGGQFLDLSSFGKSQTLAEVEDLSFRKTGALIVLCVRLGAALGEASREECAALDSFAHAYGALYQVRDDLVDALQTTEAAGKDVGIDEKNGRATFTTVLGVEGARERVRALALRARAALALLPRDTTHLGALIDVTEAI